MVDERIIELIHKDIDGVIPPAERAILAEYRTKDPEVESLAKELRAVAEELATVRPVEAPASLKARIMRELEPGLQRQETSGERLLDSVVAFFRRGTGVRLAYAFSLGIVAGIALFAVYSGSREQDWARPTDATGALIIGNSEARMETGPTVVISSDRVKGSIESQFTQNLTILTVSISSSESITSHFTFDPSVLAVRGIKKGSEGEPGLVVQGNTVEVRGSGKEEFTLYFDRKSSSPLPVRAEVYAGSDLVFAQSIETARPTL